MILRRSEKRAFKNVKKKKNDVSFTSSVILLKHMYRILSPADRQRLLNWFYLGGVIDSAAESAS